MGKVEKALQLHISRTSAHTTHKVYKWDVKDYNHFCKTYLPYYVKKDNAYFHQDALKWLYTPGNMKVQVRMWFRGAAKSVHSCLFLPMFLVSRGELEYFIIVGINQQKAYKLLADARLEFQTNTLFRAHYPNIVVDGNVDAKGRFQLIDTHNGKTIMFEAYGVGSSLRGLRHGYNRLQWVVIDDIENTAIKTQAINEEHVADIIEGILPAFDQTKKCFLLVNNNLYRKDGIIQNLIDHFKSSKNASVNISRVDIMKDGKPTWPEMYTRKIIERKRGEMGKSSFNTEYMNTPTSKGALFGEEGFTFTDLPTCNQLIGFWDFSYKKEGDYKAFTLCGMINGTLYIHEVFCQQCDFETAMDYTRYIYSAYKETHAITLYYDATASQEAVFEDMIFDNLHGDIHIIPQKLQGNKLNRVQNSLLSKWETGKVIFRKGLKTHSDIGEIKNQMITFGNNREHDDFPDALAACCELLNKNKINDRPLSVSFPQNYNV